MGFYLVQTLNALSFSVLLLLTGLGLSLVLSLMNFVNLTHGAFVLLGAYVGIYWFASGLPWPLAFAAAFAAAGLAGFVLERFPFRQFYPRPHLMQVLLTYGLSVIFADLMRWGFGAQIMTPQIPEALRGVVFLLDLPFPIYRLFIIGFGFALALGLWIVVDRTIWGAVVRACVVDRGFVETLGLDTRKIFTIVLVISAGLGGLSGALGAGILSAYPGLDEEVLILALIVVVVGGLGTFRGTVVSALLLGFTMTFAKVFVPEFSNFVALAVMAALLVLLPSGLVAQNMRQV
ncbi:branched-chain amino acid ABC transporter permease [Bradyrhizobium sp. U87765 SZCCT0131]|uniref:branched-chain amino acid ABC transporter permease n=1 Tax=unclassified Bradyrhizobium TaxID=2631580 RepID=UPI001BADF2D0|nr:branched-chain amino acid ABC transporter permease [Bradyrhizobium sp. U87765 SZCCT0131]MBR1262448.1 branched-chain amino acid ABC transporter permease [Bradyrhizobium sp. U87765 SZCCT0134]MBR1308369.1 branched-chain amino acid ABC transporter permease [Bradyrhizobium sp. U87765 SZCCT0110]MBR1318230.1 branched-chain amino acid ABC transporter permease [Bradyrhizobium sp. U87765 SZCCT0109]MBR1351933.1 branched-chain amino acid ABC transporter permease [Bradyrhizobium sp. U87765 SZCCT0048]